MTDKMRRHILELLPLTIICIAAAVYLLLAALDYGKLKAEMPVIGWTLSAQTADESMQSADTPTGTVFTLDENDDGQNTICFYSVYQTVRAYLNGEEIYRYDKPPGERLMRAAPSYWNQISLPPGSTGELEIVLETPYRQYAGVLSEVRRGTAEQVARYVLLKTAPRFVAALVILFIGVIFALVAVIMHFYAVASAEMDSLSLFIVVLGIFLAAQQTTILINVYSGISYILLQSVAFMLCPVFYTRYLARVHQGRWRKIALALYALSILNCLLIIALQIFSVRDMPQMMSLTRNLCAVVIIYVFLLEMRRKRRVLICLFALLMVYAAFHYYFTNSITWLVYCAIFGYLYMLIYRVITTVVHAQAKQIRLEAALEVSRSEIATIQITSHFFYHTLDSIRALIRLDADKAYKMTGDFAKYIRHRVDGVERMQEAIPFSRELRSIRAYVDIKQAQLGDRFEMVYDLETEDFEILPLTVQPLVENAVIHAVQRRREGGCVKLSCRETAQGYHIEVMDNGPGDAPGESADTQKQSTAVKNVNTRLEYYGIAPLAFQKNALGGMTVSLGMPKKIAWKGKMK